MTSVNFIILFSLYSFGGWIIETIYKSYKDKKFINSGFLYGPFCPIYGFSSISIILFMNSFNRFFNNNSYYSFIGKFVFIMLITSLLEYITGFLLEKIFKCRWWDYKDEFLNINRRICLKFSIIWGIIGYIFIEIINPFFSKIVYSIPLFTKKIYYISFIIYFISDILLTINEILELKQLLLKYYNKPQIQLKQKFIKYKRLYSAFPKLYFLRLGEFNVEIRRIINDKVEKIKSQFKSSG